MVAPEASHYFAAIFRKVDVALATYVDDVAGRVIGGITPLAAKLLVVYFCMWGYSVMRGTIQEPLGDGAWRILRLAIIISLMDLTTYNAYVADFFMTAPDQLAMLVTGTPGETSINFLDSLWSQLYALGEAFWQKGGATSGMSGIGLEAIAMVIWLLGLAVCIIGGGFLLIAKLGMHVWLAFGSAFILLAMFDTTKQFTNSWLGQTVSLGLLPMLTGAIMKLIPAICQEYLGAVVGVGALTDPAINQAIPALVLCGFSLILMWQVPSLASGLGGGVAISTLGVLSAAARMAKDGAGGAKNLMSGRTLSDMRSARRHKASNAAWAKKNPGMTATAAGMPMAAYRKLTSPGKNTVAKH